MKLKKLFLPAIVMAFFAFAPSTFAATYYCSNSGVVSCEDKHDNIGDFLTAVADNSQYLAVLDFEVLSDYEYVYFSGGEGVEYYIPFYIYEYLIEDSYTADGADEYFYRVNWNNFDENKNMIPDSIETYSNYFNSEVERFVDDYKLERWWSAGKPLAVYLETTGYEGLFGYYSYEPGYEYLVIDVVFYEEETVKATITHELFHAFQDSYVEDPGFLPANFAEGSATMMESKATDADDLTYLDLEGGASALFLPELSVFGGAQDLHTPLYGTFLWYSFLEKEYGKQIVRYMLQTAGEIEQEYSDLDPDYYSYLIVTGALEKVGSNILDAYNAFTAQNYEKDEYIDGDYLPDVPMIRTHDSISGSELVEDRAPALFGSNYIRFEDVEEKNLDYLEVEFSGNQGAAFTVSFLPTIGKNSILMRDVEVFYFEINQGGYIYFEIDPDGNYQDLVMVVSPVDVDYFDTDDIFNDYIYPYEYIYRYSDEVLIDEFEEIEVITGENLIGSGQAQAPFTDVASDGPYAEAIEYLKHTGIVNGYDDGSFRPYNLINRAEMLKILVEGQGVTPSVADYNNCFSDVKTEWYAPYVCYAEASGWVNGYPDGTFKPAQNINYVEALKMLLNSQNIAVPETVSYGLYGLDVNAWYTPYVNTARELGITEESDIDFFDPSELLNRARMAQYLYTAITL